MKLLEAILEFVMGHKYYVNIINTRGTIKCEMASFIHRTRAEAEAHRVQIESTASYIWVETVSFRSRKEYGKEGMV